MKKGLSITFRFREAGSRNRVAFCQVLLVHSKSFSPRPFRGSLGKISSIHIWCASQMVDRPSVSKTLNCQQDFMVLLKCEACNYFNFMSFLFSSKRLFFFFLKQGNKKSYTINYTLASWNPTGFKKITSCF